LFAGSSKLKSLLFPFLFWIEIQAMFTATATANFLAYPTTSADIVTANVAPIMAAVAPAAPAAPAHNAILAATACADLTSSNAMSAAVLEAVAFG